MTENELEELMRRAGPSYRQPKDPPLDDIWQRVEARVFGASVLPLKRRRRWIAPLAYAATLMIGVGFGWAANQNLRSSRPTEARPALATGVIPASTGPSPFVGVANDYFAQTTALVVAIAGDLRSGEIASGTVARARDLLSTTRLLLDGHLPDEGVRDLLQDLELVLAQVVRLPATRLPDADVALIAEAMDQRDVLSRLTLVLTDTKGTP